MGLNNMGMNNMNNINKKERINQNMMANDDLNSNTDVLNAMLKNNQMSKMIITTFWVKYTCFLNIILFFLTI